ncbi:hypothetical protein ABT160_44020 [Streptomyces sp. NPDC001941]|uniref:hypothetical protein n=1 Tax=Streptomyces sp. NPDC001941 TaxID=3154659 RepID=UPI003333DC91
MNSPPRPVTVTLTDTDPAQATAVLDYLGTRFHLPATDDPARGASRQAVPPTVWTAELDVAAAARPAPAAPGPPLDGTVLLTVQGAPHDVDVLRGVLEDRFLVRDEGTVSGDQEREAQFRLGP